ncbi:hypothetical protein I4U23_011302 [Adineta vaga]|nr:hypothetical protein I4U23_011302 [Adineta vaga]
MDYITDETLVLCDVKRRRILRNVVLVWIDPNIHTHDKDYQYLLTQSLEIVDTIQLIGGLLSFNAFTSTSVEKEVALDFCPIPPQDPDIVPVLFEMKIESSVKSTTFALLNNASYYSDSEGEVLFSMHTVFRIENVEQIADVLWRVKLVLTNDEDPDLKLLEKQIQTETTGSTGWSCLGKLLIHVGHFNEAKEVSRFLSEVNRTIFSAVY